MYEKFHHMQRKYTKTNEKTIYFNCFEENKIVEYLYNNAKFKICENNMCTINKEMKMYKELSFSIVF